MKKAIKWILIGFGALIVLAIVLPSNNKETTTSDSPEPTPVAEEVELIEVDTTDFVAEFDKNQLAAEEKYEGKYVRLTGYVQNISEDILGSYYLVVQPTNEKLYFETSVQCYFKDKSALTSLENGQKVTVVGRVDSQVMNVLVKDCAIE